MKTLKHTEACLSVIYRGRPTVLNCTIVTSYTVSVPAVVCQVACWAPSVAAAHSPAADAFEPVVVGTAGAGCPGK